ncbi:MAG: DUF1499 domain-containing protein [Gemmatimonadetes bacterium]|nr:DUF1499 domain-containing protein [Gemmatimonadota bacterium]
MEGSASLGSNTAKRVARAVAVLGLALAALSLLVVMAGGPGYRWEWWDLRRAFSVLTWGAYGGLAAAILSLLGLAALALTRSAGHGRAFVSAGLGVILGTVVVVVPWNWRQTARRVPPIHDITTDMESPPAFVAILPLRRDARNPVEYGGPEIAAQQKAAYPDIVPLVLDVPPSQAFERALAAAREMEWEIVDANAAEGTMEATATTFWFGFKDDLVIRITPADGGSRIDVRSVSRVGRSDLGTNARRIRGYLARLRQTGPR